MVHGPYSVVRHPIYAALFLALPGTALALDGVLEAAVFGLALPATLLWNLRLEEPVLFEGFGRTYAVYASRVPALLPRPFGRVRPLEGKGGGAVRGNGARTPPGSPL